MDTSISNIYIGDFLDWDIPSDSGVENGSNYNSDGKLIYCFGGEYGQDSLPNNDCVLANQRLGGIAYYGGYRFSTSGDIDSFPEPKAMWTHMNADWVYPTGGFVGSQLWNKMEAMGSNWETWEATAEGGTNPDSMFNDLNMVSVYGKFDIATTDTLVFVKILTTTTGGTAGITENVNKARAWIAARPEIFSWPERIEPLTCCELAGDVNHNALVNILDITYLIAYLYKGGPPPPCLDEADFQPNCIINILDITYLIAYLYKGGPAPQCGCVL